MSTPEPAILAVQRRYRARLLAGERAAAREIAHGYAQAWQAVDRQLQDLLERMQAARQAGREVGVGWLYREQRLRVLLATIEAEMARVSEKATARTIRQQEQAVDLAIAQAAETIRRTAPGEPEYVEQVAQHIERQRTRREPFQHLIGTLQDGSPVRELFDALGDEASADARAVLTAAVATGQHPRVTARQMRDAFGGNLSRALTVARTETLRAYRQSSQEVYRQPQVSQVLEGWVWMADVGPNTCAACLAMHGKMFPLHEEFGSHPNCRCSPAPRARGSRVAIETGEEWFARQDEAIQRKILGPGGYEAYRDGQARLADFVKVSHSETWGTTRTVRPLRDVLASAPAAQQPAARPDRPLLGDALIDASSRLTAALAGERPKQALYDLTQPDGPADDLLGELVAHNGFAGLPTIVSRAEFDARITAGATELLRGLHGAGAHAYARQFREGDYFPGKGAYGNGTYAAAGPGADTTARTYAGRDGAILRMMLRDDARVLEWDEQQDAVYAADITTRRGRIMEAFKEHGFEAAQREEARVFAYEDKGRWAVLHGYQAIRVPGAGGADQDYYVILDRTAVIVADDPLED